MAQELINLKTQFEVRFSPLLNFQEVYRRVLSPYLRMSKFNIFNQNTISEYIVLLFDEDGYSIDCRIDRIVFVSEGVREDLKKSGGPFLIFFEILKRIKESTTFGKINNALLAEWNFLPVSSEIKFEEIPEAFSTKFLPSLNSFNVEGLTEKDYKLTTEFKFKEKELRYEFGPFKPEKDVQTYQLNSFNKKGKEYYNKFIGLMLNGTYFEPVTDPEFSTYKSFSKMINDNSTRFYI